jgi:hypothetical protein
MTGIRRDKEASDMKKDYVKPLLVKREKLSAVTAVGGPSELTKGS